MKFKKTLEAKYTVVYSNGRRIAEFVNGEFETDDEPTIEVLKDMGYATDDFIDIAEELPIPKKVGRPRKKKIKA